MIDKLTYYISSKTNPYFNLAMEEHLLRKVQDRECILYLWQNKRTAVIGRNQNPWKECDLDLLESDSGFLARRMSGGGAVYHDLGNLNFTFLAKKENYDVEKQFQVILEGVKELGIKGERSGRNDITVDGRKFSGNAFYETKNACFHHGTILFNVDKEAMSRYLLVSEDKLVSKSVESVKSRVVNLNEYLSGINGWTMKETLLFGFSKVYGLYPDLIKEERVRQEELEDLCRKYSSWDWNYGKTISFHNETSKRFEWGEADIKIRADKGVIKELLIFSDSLEPDFIDAAAACLQNIRYTKEDVQLALQKLVPENERQKIMVSDLSAMLKALI